MGNGKKILVTGGAGYIGSHTVVALHDAGYVPVIIDDFSNSTPEAISGIEAIIGHKPEHYVINCLDTDALNSIIKGSGQIDGVIHFAAYKAVGESVAKPLRYYKNNLLSLINVIELMQVHQIPNLVFSSSCTVYGEPENSPVDENQPMAKAESPYGNTKKMCEEIIQDVVKSSDSFKAVSLRYFNPIGAHPSAKIGELPLGTPNNLVPYITQTAMGIREKLTVFGGDYDTLDGTCIRDYIHVMDLADAHIAALEYMNTPESARLDVFNIGTGKGNSVLEVIKNFEAASGQKLNYQIGKRRAGDIEKIFAEASKANSTLKWSAQRDLYTALADAWNWEKSLNIKKEIV